MTASFRSAAVDPVPSRDAWTGTDSLAAAALGVGGALICVAAIVQRPDLNAGSVFLFEDPGVNLLVAERLAEGARLYRDAGFSYGPLAIYPYVWFSMLFGNTPQAFSAFLGLVSVLNVVLAYVFLRRHVSRVAAVAAVAGGLYPTLLLPGSLVFGVQASAYFVLERLLFIAVLLSWRPPAVRHVRHALAMGLILGVWQGLRFGTALFLGAAIVVIDLLALQTLPADRTSYGRWLRVSLVTLVSFLVVEGAWAVYAFASLPASDARDFLWPAYVLEAFEVWPGERRWPRFESVRLFIGQQLIIGVSAALGLYALIQAVRSVAPRTSSGWRRPTPGDLAVLIPFVFYAFGAAGLFRSVYHFHQYAWTLPLAAALAIDLGGRWFLTAFLLLSSPGVALLVRANFITDPPPGMVVVRPPEGGHLVLSKAEHARVEAVRAYAMSPTPRSLFIMRTGAGFHALFNTRYSGRQAFFILGFARGDDADDMLRTLTTEPSAIVLTEYPLGQAPAADPCTWYGWRHFAADVCPRLAELVDVERAIRVDEETWIIPSRGPGAQAPLSRDGSIGNAPPPSPALPLRGSDALPAAERSRGRLRGSRRSRPIHAPNRRHRAVVGGLRRASATGTLRQRQASASECRS